MPFSSTDKNIQMRLEQIFRKEQIGTIDSLSGPDKRKDSRDQQAAPLKIYFIGIKGTGMCALAQLLHHLGYQVSGSDVAEHFYTEELLRASGISYFQGFSSDNLPSACDLVIYSAAYDSKNPEYAAAEKRGEQLPMLNYPQALGFISRIFTDCIAIAGTHGKTTSTLLCSALMQSLTCPGTAVAGAGAPHLGGNAFLAQGTEILAVETCEYRNHFFHFQPGIVLLTSLEWDHQDFFTSYSMMQQSFRKFMDKDSIHSIVYCADDPGVCELIDSYRRDLQAARQAENGAPRSQPEFVPYGYAAIGDFAIASIESMAGETVLRLASWPDYPLRLRVPGEHLALNAVGALAALYQSRWVQHKYSSFAELIQQSYREIVDGLQLFRGASRRSEILGEILLPNQELDQSKAEAAVLVLDDYAHHPTAVRKTLAGYKRFYPQRRLVLDFMSHTYSRTESLHRQFSECFDAADVLILHDIYGSARETPNESYNGQTLWQAVNQHRAEQRQAPAEFFPQPLDALPALEQLLQAGDLFVTMGAGSNRELALALLQKYQVTSQNTKQIARG